MITLEVRAFDSTDVNPAEKPDASEVYFGFEFEVGQQGVPGADLFQVLITTPEGLRQKAHERRPHLLAGRATLVLSQYSWSITRDLVNDIVAASARETWTESVLVLQRHFRWEYEDYEQTSP